MARTGIPRQPLTGESLVTQIDVLKDEAQAAKDLIYALLDQWMLPGVVTPSIVQAGRTIKQAMEHLEAAQLITKSLEKHR